MIGVGHHVFKGLVRPGKTRGNGKKQGDGADSTAFWSLHRSAAKASIVSILCGWLSRLRDSLIRYPLLHNCGTRVPGNAGSLKERDCDTMSGDFLESHQEALCR